jgi:hypothetical protein
MALDYYSPSGFQIFLRSWFDTWSYAYILIEHDVVSILLVNIGLLIIYASKT